MPTSFKVSLNGRRLPYAILLAIAALAALALVLLFFPWPGQAVPGAPATTHLASSSASVDLGKLPLQFEPNVGQADSEAGFVVHSQGANFYFTTTDVLISVPNYAPARPGPTAGTTPIPLLNLKSRFTFPANAPRTMKGAIDRTAQANQAGSPPGLARLSFVHVDSRAVLTNSDALPGKVNYFLGNDPTKWRTNIPTYSGLTYKGLYPGIDLSYTGDAHQLKGTYTVAPGADPSLIGWRYDVPGPGYKLSSVTVDSSGNLQISISSALSPQPSLLTEQAPVAWQMAGDKQVPVSAHYIVDTGGTVGFELGSYDHSRALTIDPYLTYSTYLGGEAGDTGSRIATDAAGNIYVDGATDSLAFPLHNPIQPILGWQDAFVTKLTPDGSTLLFSTYLGGLYVEDALDLSLDPSGNVYMVGVTDSEDFPILNAYQPVPGGGPEDAFVTKLNSTGSALIYSTFLGGNNDDVGWGITTDATGNAYVTGYTLSPDFPVHNAYQPNLADNAYDFFVTKLAPNGLSAVYSTYFGGPGSDGDSPMEFPYDAAIAVDSAGNVTVCGFSEGMHFPILNAIQPNPGGGISDAVVFKLDAGGSTLIYSTYLGGNDLDAANAVTVNSAGNAYVVGVADSTNFPVHNAFQPNYGGGTDDAFVAKLASDGSSLFYSTYLGGTREDIAWSVVVDNGGNAYVDGMTASFAGFPQVNPIQQFGGADDVFVTVFNSAGSGLSLSTFLGGSYIDGAFGIAIRNGAIYTTGRTWSNDFPTVNAFQPHPVMGFGFEAFISIISGQPPATATPTITGTPPSATPTACAADSDYNIALSSGATIVPGTDRVPGSQCNDCELTIPLPFPFKMYGRTFDTAYADSNGYLQFSSRYDDYYSECLPAAWFGYALVPHWDDLNALPILGPDLGIYTSTSGTAPNRVFNVEWRTCLNLLDQCYPVNFEVRLYENSPSQQVDFIYGQVANEGSNAVVGVQKYDTGGYRYTTFDCHIGGLTPGTRLTLTLPVCATTTPTGTPPTPTPSPTCSTSVGTGPWSLASTGPRDREYMGSAGDGQYIYVYGGLAGNWGSHQAISEVWRYDPSVDQWTQLADMPAARCCSQGAYYDGHLYVPGGTNYPTYLTGNSIYDIEGNSWSNGAPLPQPRSDPAVAACNGKIYVFSGEPDEGQLLPTGIYDIATNSWSAGTGVGVQLPNSKAITVGGYIYLVGGTYGGYGLDRSTATILTPTPGQVWLRSKRPAAKKCS